MWNRLYGLIQCDKLFDEALHKYMACCAQNNTRNMNENNGTIRVISIDPLHALL